MSDDDLVLCERAAKAAGVKVRRGEYSGAERLIVVDDDHSICKSDACFRPLQDDSQAFRLAVHLRISIIHEEESAGGKPTAIAEAMGPEREDGSRFCPMHSLDDDPPATIRRLIVECAAEMAP